MLHVTFKKRLQWWENKKSFLLDGKAYPYFVHLQNCGWPPFRMTERSVELSLADAWLSEREGDPAVIEVGAVTPYYWPRRVTQVIDPYDNSRLAEKKSLFDVSFIGRKVLSVSTFEHVGTGEYAQPGDVNLVVKAIEKLVNEAEAFLVTMPAGYNKTLDKFFLENQRLSDDVQVLFMKRGKGMMDNRWVQSGAEEGIKAGYGKTANGLIILKRVGHLQGKS